jgi:hypothetical protein
MTEVFEEKKKQLLDWLQIALELELATIPPYLVALLSIKLPSNREAAEIIRGVMIEEMLHFGLVANVINAVDGRPRLDATALPSYPLQMTFEGKPFRDRKFPIDLAPFSAETIATFLKIEQPETVPPDLHLLKFELSVPALTIGQFYRKIEELLIELDQMLPNRLFSGSPTRQLQPDYYWSSGGSMMVIDDLASARKALDLVVSQGEGAPTQTATVTTKPDSKTTPLGHYFRFNEIANGRRYKNGDDPTRPTGEKIAVDFGAVYPVKPNPRATDYPLGSELAALNDAFNLRYTAMLLQLNEAINGTPKSLYTAIMNGMHGITPLAHLMMTHAIPDDGQNRVGCPTFEWKT